MRIVVGENSLILPISKEIAVLFPPETSSLRSVSAPVCTLASGKWSDWYPLTDQQDFSVLSVQKVQKSP